MNRQFAAFIQHARGLAEAHGLIWKIRTVEDGTIIKKHVWDLGALVGAPPPRALISDLGLHPKALLLLNNRRAANGEALIPERPLPQHWQDLIKAAVLDQVLVRKNQPMPVVNNVLRPLRILATCASVVDPWAITLDHLIFAREIAAEMAASGQYALMIASIARELFDKYSLADRSPLAGLLAGSVTKGLPSTTHSKGADAREYRRTQAIRKSLNERKASEKLPAHRAFWELIRIVFTEKPRTFTDVIRFAEIKLLVLCGFRIGEACIIPHDWRRTQEHLDYLGRPAGDVGGISQSLMIRHFAEKQRGKDDNSVELYEAVQHVPPIFEEIIEETLGEVERLTTPLRTRLKLQTETGLLFPELVNQDRVTTWEMYPRIHGNVEFVQDCVPQTLIERYKETFDVAVLDEINRIQMEHPKKSFLNQATHYWSRLNLINAIPDLKAGRKERNNWRVATLRLSSFEQHVRKIMPTKLPDVQPLPLADGRKIYPHELLFLAPKRPLVEEREEGICDVSRYFGVGYASTQDLTVQLGSKEQTIFRRYGQTDEDRHLELNSHALRHLQNTELFRLGVADTIITKRYNRRSVAQSYVYDHRSLAEDLDAIDVPPGAEDMGEKALQAYKMIKGGKIEGGLVQDFKTIQRRDGDAAAFAFLSVEASGHHATPYGTCLQAFTVDPCPVHLECFGGCRHLGATNNPEHRTNLEGMGGKFKVAIQKIEALPPTSVGRDNQLAHANKRLAGLEKILATPPGEKPFPDGPDLSDPIEPLIKKSVLDD